MDPFTQKMLLKAEQRQKLFEGRLPTIEPLREQNYISNFDNFGLDRELEPFEPKKNCFEKKAENPASRVTKTYSVDNDDVDIEINITANPNTEVKVQIEEQTIDQPNGDRHGQSTQSTSLIRDSSRNRLHRLGALYSETENHSSPISRTEHKFHENKEDIEPPNTKGKIRTGKLVALANVIKNWEDDVPAKSTSNKIAEAKEEKQSLLSEKPVQKMPNDVRLKENVANTKKTKDLKWDQKVINSLEAQGFQRRESTNTKISYNFKDQAPSCSVVKSVLKRTVDAEDNETKKISYSSKNNAVSNSGPSVKNRIISFDNSANAAKRVQKDPTEMSLKERMQLFEKNKGEALVPKTCYGIAAAAGSAANKNNNKVIQKPNEIVRSNTDHNKVTFNIGKEKKINDKALVLNNNSTTISECTILQEIEKQKQADMEVIAHRYKKGNDDVVNKEEKKIPSPPPMPTFTSSNKRASPGSIANNEEKECDFSKKPRVSKSNEPNRLYPVLSSLESLEDEKSVTSPQQARRSSNSSKTIEGNTYFNQQPNRNRYSENINDVSKRKNSSSNGEYYFGDSSTISSETSGLDDYLNEALEEDVNDSDSDDGDDMNYPNAVRIEGVSGTPLQSVKSESFSYKKNDPITAKTSTTVDTSDDNNLVTLVHTVSFYRKQQSTNNKSTPVRKEIRIQEESSDYSDNVSVNSSEKDDSDDQCDNRKTRSVQEKIEKLSNEVCKQQQIIGQTSQALNLCASTIEFSGSTESVEGERHLLVATHRRQLALDEIQRLRIEGSLRPLGAPKEKGRLTVREITIPLRNDYIRKLSADTITGHHLVCLLKYNDIVLATKTVPTLPGLLAVKFPDVLQLDYVYADFKVTLEIYGMTAQREVLPHEIKYHINLNKKCGIKTPKKKLIGTMSHSPAVSNIVRTPAFVQYGFAIFSLREIQRNTWSLNQVSGVSPLDGTVSMKLDCELQVAIEYKGFLTMFEDISGFGAWHRRWCHLNGNILSYWKYPDDEKKKAPMGSIDLYNCCSMKVANAPRDLCARLNTLLVECNRAPQDDDFESLIVVPKGNVTIIRSLLSADTKEERDEWCAHLNKALMLIRAWGPRN